MAKQQKKPRKLAKPVTAKAWAVVHRTGRFDHYMGDEPVSVFRLTDDAKESSMAQKPGARVVRVTITEDVR